MHARKAASLRLAQALLGGELTFEKAHEVLAEDVANAVSLGLEEDEAFQEAIKLNRARARKLAKAVSDEFEGKRPSLWRLASFIQGLDDIALPWAAQKVTKPKMRPAAGKPKAWKVPKILTSSELANWLNLTFGELDWFANIRGFGEGASKLQHYHRRWLRKTNGSFRLIESPKQRLKGIQRAILTSILEKIPPHETAHGFRAGRSIVSFAVPHAGKAMVLKLDLRDFFPTFRFTRVQHLFLTAGYPEMVARLLAGLCVTRCPHSVLNELEEKERLRAKQIYGRAHLPQGAPTSPMLANLCAFNLDCRLSGLAKAAGGVYTRYADDLIFSGDAEFARGAKRFLIHAMAVAMEEGFDVNSRKTRLMRPGVSQRAAGLTLNAHPNVPRKEYDRLKAILTNCARKGPSSQNREGMNDFRTHLAGKISFVSMVNAARGEKLKTILEKIDWEK